MCFDGRGKYFKLVSLVIIEILIVIIHLSYLPSLVQGRQHCKCVSCDFKYVFYTMCLSLLLHTIRMDVIALRKESGTITGDILLNGFPQESNSFRRCSGYVEQFDVQSAELTVRETIRFSAQLRLDNPVYDTPEGFEDHVTSIIETLELTREADVLVGSVEEGGLTFEQKKRLSIAVELAASPSIIFLE